MLEEIREMYGTVLTAVYEVCHVLTVNAQVVPEFIQKAYNNALQEAESSSGLNVTEFSTLVRSMAEQEHKEGAQGEGRVEDANDALPIESQGPAPPLDGQSATEGLQSRRCGRKWHRVPTRGG